MVTKVALNKYFPEYYTYQGIAGYGQQVMKIAKTLPSIDNWIQTTLATQLEVGLQSEGAVPLRITVFFRDVGSYWEVDVRVIAYDPGSLQVSPIILISAAFMFLMVAIAAWAIGEGIVNFKELVWGPSGQMSWVPMAFVIGAAALFVTSITKFMTGKKGATLTVRTK